MSSILITGATSGIGLVCARVFRDAGWEVFGTGRRPDGVADLKASLGIEAHVCDGRDPAQIRHLFQNLPALDVLINNAAIYQRNDWLNSSEADFDQMFEANVQSVFFFCQEAIRNFQTHQRKGLVLNNASSLGQKPAPGTSLYSASKAAVLSLTKSLAQEYAPDIRCNAVLPGVVETPIHEKTMGLAEATRFKQEIAGFHPLKRLGQPEEIARLLLYLSQPEATWITGSLFVIDGGISLVS